MPIKIYLYPIEPEKYPDYQRRYAKAITHGDLENRIHFTAIRGFQTSSPDMEAIGKAADTGERPIQDNGSRINKIEETLEAYVDHFRLCDVIWPVYMTLFASNLDELLDACAKRGLYLYDFWGYVPGSRTVKEMWGEYSIPEKTDAQMKELLGNRFLGYDNGEQDGRYIHAYAETSFPQCFDRKRQYKNFQAYFEKLNDAMQNHTVTLSSLTFLHYFAREGSTIMLGAETAQALPSNPMWYSFIRGAAKQYGLLPYGNVSVWNRWGAKGYGWLDEEPDTSMGYESGRTAGTSLSLLKRLIYNQYMYGCDILGFESGWLQTRKAEEGEETTEQTLIQNGTASYLTPIGDIQYHCVRFVEKHGKPGIHYAPVALIADAFSGWVPPRHLYSPYLYRVWGNIPYGDGDYQLHGIFDLLFPGYEDSGFFRDERGFMTPTPYGEIADVLLSDVSSEVLCRYDTAVLLSGVARDKEFCEKMKKFVSRGGHLIVFGSSPIGQHPNITVIPGNGLTETGDICCRNELNEPICHPYRLSDSAVGILDRAFTSLQLLRVDNPALQYTLSIRDPETYTLFVSNNTYADEYFDILAPDGVCILSIEEWVIDDTSAEYDEYLPRKKYRQDAKARKNTGAYSLSSHCCRIFSVKTTPMKVEELPETYPEARDEKLYLSFGYGKACAKDYLLWHPTLTQHFRGLMIPAEYFNRISEETAKREGHYFRQQKVSVIVDFSAMLNHVPDLTIIGNFPNRTEQSVQKMQNILQKATEYGCDGAVFYIHRNAENEWSKENALETIFTVLQRMKAYCDTLQISAYLTNNNRLELSSYEMQLAFTRQPASPALAYNTAFSQLDGGEINIPEDTGLLLLSEVGTDVLGQTYQFNLPIVGSIHAGVLKQAYLTAKAHDIPVVLCAEYPDDDSITDDLLFLQS